MKKLYIDALQNLKSSERPMYAPFKTSWSYLEPSIVQGENSAPKDEVILKSTDEKPVTEKKEVLESFAGYAQEKLVEQDKISFQGGEVKQKSLDLSFELFPAGFEI